MLRETRARRQIIHNRRTRRCKRNIYRNVRVQVSTDKPIFNDHDARFDYRKRLRSHIRLL